MHARIFDIDGTLLQSDVSDDAMFLESVRGGLGDVKLRDSWGSYTQFTAAGILSEILLDNNLEASPERVAAVRSRFIEGVRDHMAEHGPFKEIPGALAYVQSLHTSATHRIAYATGPLVVSCGTQQSELLVVVEPGGHVGRLPLSLSTCPRGSNRESGFEHWSGSAVHQRVGTAAALGG